MDIEFSLINFLLGTFKIFGSVICELNFFFGFLKRLKPLVLFRSVLKGIDWGSLFSLWELPFLNFAIGIWYGVIFFGTSFTLSPRTNLFQTFSTVPKIRLNVYHLGSCASPLRWLLLLPFTSMFINIGSWVPPNASFFSLISFSSLP